MTAIILGREWTINFVPSPTERDTFMGQMDNRNGVIGLLKTLKPDFLEEAFLHEVLHAVSEELGIDLKENIIQALSAGLYSCDRIKVDLNGKEAIE